MPASGISSPSWLSIPIRCAPGIVPIRRGSRRRRSQARRADSSKSDASAGRTCQPVTAFPNTCMDRMFGNSRRRLSWCSLVVASHTPLSAGSCVALVAEYENNLARNVDSETAEHGAGGRRQLGDGVEHEPMRHGLALPGGKEHVIRRQNWHGAAGLRHRTQYRTSISVSGSPPTRAYARRPRRPSPSMPLVEALRHRVELRGRLAVRRDWLALCDGLVQGRELLRGSALLRVS